MGEGCHPHACIFRLKLLSMHVKLLQKNWLCWKCVARKYGFVCLYFDLLRWNSYLKSLTSLNITFSGLGGREVTLQTAVQQVLGSIPGSGEDFYVYFFVLLVLSYFLSKNTLFTFGILQFLLQYVTGNSFRILNILQILWPIIRV